MRRIGQWLGIAVLVLAVAGCSQLGGEATEAAPPPVVTQVDPDVVLAEGRVEAAEGRTLSFESGGTLMEQLVDEGDRVEKGDLLLRLDPTDAELAVRQAEAAVAQAEAQLARLDAGPRPEDIAVLEAQIEAAHTAITQTYAQRAQLSAGGLDAEIAAAEAEVAGAISQEYVAREAHEDHEKEETRLQWIAAQQQLAAAQKHLEVLQPQHDAQLYTSYTTISAAKAEAEVAKARLEQIKAPVQEAEIEAAEAALEEAEVALEKARVALDRTELRAPFAGTVTAVMVEEGTAINYGTPVLKLATLDALQVRTIDLDELDVAQIEVGKTARVTLDALPDVELDGHVSEIGLEAVDYRGDVTYPVTIVLDEVHPQARLGMTALVYFEAE